jgi:hypothetical protein
MCKGLGNENGNGNWVGVFSFFSFLLFSLLLRIKSWIGSQIQWPWPSYDRFRGLGWFFVLGFHLQGYSYIVAKRGPIGEALVGFLAPFLAFAFSISCV